MKEICCLSCLLGLDSWMVTSFIYIITTVVDANHGWTTYRCLISKHV
jgi:DMSO reductase anchor subunit